MGFYPKKDYEVFYEVCTADTGETLWGGDTQPLSDVVCLKYARFNDRGGGQVMTTEEIICTWCMDNTKSCKACDDGYEGE